MHSKVTSKTCRDLDGQVFEVNDARVGENYPPMHPWCRSTTVAHFDDEALDSMERRAKNPVTGEVEIVEPGMTYKHWYSKYVEPDKATKYDKEVITRYIGGGSYALNEKLRDGKPLNAEERDWVGRLNTALAKMPDYDGVAQRSIMLTPGRNLTKFIEEHSIGSMVQYPAFSSFSKLDDYNPEANVQLIVNSKKGKDISSLNEDEQEVLYPTQSVFYVSEHRLDGDVHYFTLEE